MATMHAMRQRHLSQLTCSKLPSSSGRYAGQHHPALTRQQHRIMPCQRPVVEAKAAAKAAAPAAAKVVVPAATAMAALLQPYYSSIIWLSTLYTVPFFALMILAPQWYRTRRIMRSLWIFVPLAVLYVVLLAASWRPDTLAILLPGSLSDGLKGGFNPQFFPSIEGISALFQRPATAVSVWVHIVFVNLFVARFIYFDGLENFVTTWHSLLLTLLLGPVGLITHAITKMLTQHNAAKKPRRRPDTVIPNGQGSITLRSYDN